MNQLGTTYSTDISGILNKNEELYYEPQQQSC